MEPAVVNVEATILTASFEPDSLAGAVEILVTTHAAEDVPVEGGAPSIVDPRLDVHEELTGSVIANEVLDAVEVEATRGNPSHLAEVVTNYARVTYQAVIDGLARRHEGTGIPQEGRLDLNGDSARRRRTGAGYDAQQQK